MINPEAKEANKEHPEIVSSTYLHQYIKTADELIDWGLTKLGLGLQTVELTRKMCEICVSDAIETYTKWASFETQDIIVPLKGYDREKGLDLSKYNIADIHDISFRRDSLMHCFGTDIFFGPYGMMQSYAGSGIFPYSSFGNGMMGGSWTSLHNLSEHFKMIGRVTGSSPQFRYSRYTKRLKITPAPKAVDDPKNCILIVCECEPEMEELYGNQYVKRLFLANLKIQLGDVRKKFSSVQLIGGGQIDTSIGERGQEEWDRAVEELRNSESFGTIFMRG